MSVTGADIKALFNRKVNAPYSQALGDTKLSALLNEALTKQCESIFKNSQRDSTTDYINNLVEVGIAAAVVNNTIDMTTEFSNYSHFRDLQATIQDVSFSAVMIKYTLNNLKTQVIFDKPSALREGELLKITGTTIDGTWWVKMLAPTIYELYQNEALTTPVYDGVPYANTGTAQRVIKRYCREMISGTKISQLSTGTLYYPKYTQGVDTLTFYTGNNTVLSASADYLKNLTVLIDVSDSTDDLTETYPINLLYLVLDRAAELFASETRDPSLYQTETMEVNKTQQ